MTTPRRWEWSSASLGRSARPVFPCLENETIPFFGGPWLGLYVRTAGEKLPLEIWVPRDDSGRYCLFTTRSAGVHRVGAIYRWTRASEPASVAFARESAYT